MKTINQPVYYINPELNTINSGLINKIELVDDQTYYSIDNCEDTTFTEENLYETIGECWFALYTQLEIQQKLEKHLITGHTHWQDGGLGITNFEPERKLLFDTAIELSGFSQMLETSEVGIFPYAKGHCCLKCITHHPYAQDLTEFWKVYEKLEKLIENS